MLLTWAQCKPSPQLAVGVTVSVTARNAVTAGGQQCVTVGVTVDVTVGVTVGVTVARNGGCNGGCNGERNGGRSSGV